ncbi:hypothetical protein LINPERPRIM_LOCUS17331 [Linum perenne]
MVTGFSYIPNVSLALALAVLLTSVYQSSSSAPPPLLVTADEDQPTHVLRGRNWRYEISLHVLTALLFLVFLFYFACLCIPRKTTLLMVQVVLSDRAGDIGILLHDVAKSCQMTKSTVLKGTVEVLLEHQSSFIYGSVEVKRRCSDSLRWLVMKQLEKQGIQRVLLDNQKFVPKPTSKQGKDYTLVTIMADAGAGGVEPLAPIESSEDIKEALNCLVSRMPIKKAEVIWAYIDPLSMQDLLESYPNLNSILV